MVSAGLALVTGLAAALGAVCRATLDRWISRWAPSGFPFGTLAVNASGSAVLGVIAGAGVGGDARYVLAGAFLGSYTTLSTWVFETDRLAEEGEYPRAALNLVLSVSIGLGAAALGWRAGAGLP